MQTLFNSQNLFNGVSFKLPKTEIKTFIEEPDKNPVKALHIFVIFDLNDYSKRSLKQIQNTIFNLAENDPMGDDYDIVEYQLTKSTNDNILTNEKPEKRFESLLGENYTEKLTYEHYKITWTLHR